MMLTACHLWIMGLWAVFLIYWLIAVRHPIYSGVLLMMVGTAIGLMPTWWSMFAAAAAYFLYSAVRGEADDRVFPRYLSGLSRTDQNDRAVPSVRWARWVNR